MPPPSQRRALITGAAGFIGFHVARKLLAAGWAVSGIDSLSPFYDPQLKRDRLAILHAMPGFDFTEAAMERPGVTSGVVARARADIVIHLAAQAGVRVPLDQARTYVESNVMATFELLEALRCLPPRHLLLASTSSVYGASPDLPFRESAAAGHPLSFYAGTKRATEVMAHAHAHLFDIPVTVTRFFTVYGPWGRPDMALYRFVAAMEMGDEIEVYNQGRAKRQFTYIDDLVEGLRRLIECIPGGQPVCDNDTLSRSAPFRTVNIAAGPSLSLVEYIHAMERATGRKARRRHLPIQPGEMQVTAADNSLLASLVGELPQTHVDVGIQAFVDWYRSYIPGG